MIVRKDQIEAFEVDARAQFIHFMQSHLGEYFPGPCQALGKEGVGQAIEAGIARAEQFEMVAERDVCKFIDLQFAFGQSFDCEEWAKEVLEDPEIRNPSTRIDALMDQAEAHLKSLQANGTTS